jgi:hypothetical protein
MSYTNLDLVKRHVSFFDFPSGVKTDYPVAFSDVEWVDLPGRPIVESTVTVKAMKDYAPAIEHVILTDGEVPLSHQRLVPLSMTVASDSSLGIVYKENTDYAVNCTAGTIKRIADGNIQSDSEVVIWYYFYSVYTEGVDYNVDYREGMIRRLAGGGILPGQTVLVDFELSGQQISDELVGGAVQEANTIIEGQIDPDRQFGADLTLQTAATYLAVSILCRILAAGGLRTGISDRQRAVSWLALAESYRSDYHGLVKAFRPGASRMSRPVRS